jgi:hypothetical protein
MRKKVFKSLLLIVCFLHLGCAGVKIVEDRRSDEKTRLVEDYSYDIRIPYFRSLHFMYVPTPVDIAKLCKGKEWKDFYISGTALGGFISYLTLGIVNLQKVEATCLN